MLDIQDIFYYLDLGLPSVQSTVCKCINYVNFVKIIINRGIRLIVSNIFVNTVYFVFGSQKKVLSFISGLIIRLRADLKCLAEIFFHDCYTEFRKEFSEFHKV